MHQVCGSTSTNTGSAPTSPRHWRWRHSERRDEHFIAGADIEGEQGQMESNGAVADGDAGSGAADGGDFLLEFQDVRAEGADPGTADGLDDIAFFIAGEIGDGNGDVFQIGLLAGCPRKAAPNGGSLRIAAKRSPCAAAVSTSSSPLTAVANSPTGSMRCRNHSRADHNALGSRTVPAVQRANSLCLPTTTRPVSSQILSAIA